MTGLYEIGSGRRELDNNIKQFSGYWKIHSILCLTRAGLPTLRGLILTEWTDDIRSAVNRYAVEHGFKEFLIRHDRRPEQPPYPAGGYLVPLHQLEREAHWYLSQGRIVILLEPFSPLDNGYNLSAMFLSVDRVRIEIVGPGFDASDLQRGHSSPHESLELNLTVLEHRGQITEDSVRRAISFHQYVSSNEYTSSVRRRFEKIQKKFIHHQRDFNISENCSDDVIDQVRHYLHESGHPALLLAIVYLTNHRSCATLLGGRHAGPTQGLRRPPSERQGPS